eukprot:GEMP01075030.1.p1 GENE.GEMP01075030.1~~GEMP01075030.1.p1  ORF type:complete len:108 (+),score=10.79 GEMP01075030.1:274-597(+)
MIDQKKKGYIDRKLGRYWFRALGWCNTDKQLDQMLDYKEDAKAAERWSRIDLADIASKYWSQRSNCPREMVCRHRIFSPIGSREPFPSATRATLNRLTAGGGRDPKI